MIAVGRFVLPWHRLALNVTVTIFNGGFTAHFSLHIAFRTIAHVL